VPADDSGVQPTPTAADPDGIVHVGRQPIYDRDGVVLAYELLFRGSVRDLKAARRDATATRQVVDAVFTHIGLTALVGDRPCFINLTREFLVGDLELPFDGNQVGLEIVPGIIVDDTVRAGIATLVDRGYCVAVDDFVYPDGRETLLPLATYVKVDMLEADSDTLARTLAHCRRYAHLHLIATRLETPAHLTLAMDLGFEMFQGNALGRPHIISTRISSRTG
jgi:EAL and modified HD-GYP domain-containing signal transduction protein